MEVGLLHTTPPRIPSEFPSDFVFKGNRENFTLDPMVPCSNHLQLGCPSRRLNSGKAKCSDGLCIVGCRRNSGRWFDQHTHTVSGWWFGTWMLFFHSVGNVIIPTDELAYFFRGVGQPPTRKLWYKFPFILIFWYIPHEISTNHQPVILS